MPFRSYTQKTPSGNTVVGPQTVQPQARAAQPDPIDMTAYGELINKYGLDGSTPDRATQAGTAVGELESKYGVVARDPKEDIAESERVVAEEAARQRAERVAAGQKRIEAELGNDRVNNAGLPSEAEEVMLRALAEQADTNAVLRAEEMAGMVDRQRAAYAFERAARANQLVDIDGQARAALAEALVNGDKLIDRDPGSVGAVGGATPEQLLATIGASDPEAFKRDVLNAVKRKFDLEDYEAEYQAIADRAAAEAEQGDALRERADKLEEDRLAAEAKRETGTLGLEKSRSGFLTAALAGDDNPLEQQGDQDVRRQKLEQYFDSAILSYQETGQLPSDWWANLPAAQQMEITNLIGRGASYGSENYNPGGRRRSTEAKTQSVDEGRKIILGYLEDAIDALK